MVESLSTQEIILYALALFFGVDKGLPAYKTWRNGRNTFNNQRANDLAAAELKFVSKELFEERTDHLRGTLADVKRDLSSVKVDVVDVKTDLKELLRRTPNQ